MKLDWNLQLPLIVKLDLFASALLKTHYSSIKTENSKWSRILRASIVPTFCQLIGNVCLFLNDGPLHLILTRSVYDVSSKVSGSFRGSLLQETGVLKCSPSYINSGAKVSFIPHSQHHIKQPPTLYTTNGLVRSHLYYKIEHTLQHEVSPPRQVYLASAGDHKFIFKYIHPVDFEDLRVINDRLRSASNHVRLSVDTIPDKSMFVFDHFTGHLLTLAQKNLPLGVVKRILKNALTGIAELHDRDIVHTDIKADNVFVKWKNSHDEIIVSQVQLGDLEDAAHIPPDCNMVGKQAENWMWRSPEAHARGPINKPSDIFSFALVCICAVHKQIVFAVREDELEEGVDPLAVVIERQISYFADEEGLNGFLKYLGDNPWVRIVEVTRDGFNKESPREPFTFWNRVDDGFKSLVCAMTCFDPAKRITARQALEHKWFDGA